MGLKCFLKCFFLWFSFKSRSGLSALRSWKSAGSSLASVEQKAIPKSSWLSFSVDADCYPLSSFGDLNVDLVDDLYCQWGFYLMIWTWRWERERRVGEMEFHAEGTVGGFEDGFVGGVFEGIFQMGVVEVTDCCEYCAEYSLGWMQTFLALVSLMSFRLLRFVEVSISSGCSPSVFLASDGDCGGGCGGGWDGGCIDVAGWVGSGFGLLFLLLLLLLLCCWLCCLVDRCLSPF